MLGTRLCLASLAGSPTALHITCCWLLGIVRGVLPSWERPKALARHPVGQPSAVDLGSGCGVGGSPRMSQWKLDNGSLLVFIVLAKGHV